MRSGWAITKSHGPMKNDPATNGRACAIAIEDLRMCPGLWPWEHLFLAVAAATPPSPDAMVGARLHAFVRNRPWTPTLHIAGRLLLEPGIHVVTGPSGHGKSLLLSLLAGYPMPGTRLRPRGFDFRGEPLLKGRPPRRGFPDGRIRAALCKGYRQTPCIFLPQTLPNVPKGEMTVKGLLQMVADGVCAIRGGAKPANRRGQKPKAILKALFGSSDWYAQFEAMLNKDVSALSGGERRRVEVAARLFGLWRLNIPGTILIMDEPTTGLDDANAKECFRLIEQACGDDTVFIVATHAPEAIPSRRSTISVRKRLTRQGLPVIRITQQCLTEGDA